MPSFLKFNYLEGLLADSYVFLIICNPLFSFHLLQKGMSFNFQVQINVGSCLALCYLKVIVSLFFSALFNQMNLDTPSINSESKQTRSSTCSWEEDIAAFIQRENGFFFSHKITFVMWQ